VETGDTGAVIARPKSQALRALVDASPSLRS